jgi:hypothetical protein
MFLNAVCVAICLDLIDAYLYIGVKCRNILRVNECKG